MDASTRAVSLIARFEGRRLVAYRDPAGVPTIGFGTTVYPTGVKVRMGDAISLNEAKEYLAFSCARFADAVSDLSSGTTLNQNQFDALVSFTYNVGIGAFRDSTMLRRLRAKDLDGAASEFPRWNKATIRGVKQELPGLTKRRKAERALFEAPLRRSGATSVGPTRDPDPVSGLLFDDGGKIVVVFEDGAGHVTDILELPDRSPATLAILLQQQPSLRTFAPAAAGERIPPGERIRARIRPHPVPRVPTAPTLHRTVLARGSEDGEEFPGRDVHELQTRLRNLGYYSGRSTGVFDSATHQAVVAFQAAHLGTQRADGQVDARTWATLFPVSRRTPTKPKPGGRPPEPQTHGGKTFLRLTRTRDIDRGLRILDLQYVKRGRRVDSIEVCSGVAGRQKFRTGKDSRVGSLEPLPEGRWFIHDILWRDGPDNYEGRVWNKGLGPVKINLDFKGPGRTARSAIQIHIDWNADSAPGTAGCIGVSNRADFRTLVTWLRDTDPRDLFVDYGLGTCPRP